MRTDVLIVGQGVAGTWLSYYLEKEGARFLLIDREDPQSPSRIAAGTMNPVTGRRYQTTWMADRIFPFAKNAYLELGARLQIQALSERTIIEFFAGAENRIRFAERIPEADGYLELETDKERWSCNFRYEMGSGVIRPAYTAHLETMLPAWRHYLASTGCLLEEEFDFSEWEITPDTICYRQHEAACIIFCEGTRSQAHALFRNLPFAPNKGEALTLHIPDLPQTHIFKKGMMLIPLATPGHWWLGSGYAWDFTDVNPTPAFREKTEAQLKNWLRLPFSVTGHLAGLRPATVERRPFVGFHPRFGRVGILNGLGSKGCSLAPYFASQLTDHFLHGKPLAPEADIRRFTHVLSRE